MNFKKVVQRILDKASEDGAVNTAISVNSDEGNSSTHVSSKQRIVQRNGRTIVNERTIESSKGGNDESTA